MDSHDSKEAALQYILATLEITYLVFSYMDEDFGFVNSAYSLEEKL